MSSFVSFASGGTPTNIDTTYEFYGITSAGAGTAITAAGSTNTKGSYTELTASTTSDLAGFWIRVSVSGNNAHRFLFDIATGAAASEVVLIPDVFTMPSTQTSLGPMFIFCPINVAAGTRISARCQCSSASGSFKMAIIGEVRTANHPPLWNSCEAISSAPTGTFASGTSITAVTTAATGYTTISDPTARTYGALIAQIGLNVTGTAPTTDQAVTLRLATGAAASEVVFWQNPTTASVSSPYLGRQTMLPIYKSVTSGARISGEVLAATAGAADIFAPQLLGFY